MGADAFSLCLPSGRSDIASDLIYNCEADRPAFRSRAGCCADRKGQELPWAARDSDPRPSGCKADHDLPKGIPNSPVRTSLRYNAPMAVPEPIPFREIQI
jgi:hypothetical protein